MQVSYSGSHKTRPSCHKLDTPDRDLSISFPVTPPCIISLPFSVFSLLQYLTGIFLLWVFFL
jgi:hypothetical protein